MEIGIDERSFHNTRLLGSMTPEDFVDKAADLGANGVGLDYFTLPGRLRRDPAPLKERLEAHGLLVVFGFRLPFVLPDAAFYLMDRHKRRAFKIAHELGASVIPVTGGLVLPLPGLRPIHVSLSKRAEPAWVASRLRSVCRDARAEGLTIALENRNDYRSTEILEILERAGSDALRVALDTGSPAALGEDPYEAAVRLAPHAAYIHFKDAAGRGLGRRTRPPGEGELDMPRIFDLLRRSGYGGLYSVGVDLPLWRRSDEESRIAGLIAYLRGMEQN